MDDILKNQAKTKKTTDTAGDIGLASGLILASNEDTQEIGLGLAAAGLLSKLASAAANPKADTRTWDNLPQFLSFAALSLPAGKQTVEVEFLDAGGRLIPSLTKTATFDVASTRNDIVLFISEQTKSN